MRAFALLLVFSVDQPVSDPPKVEETVVVTATRSERAVSEVPLSGRSRGRAERGAGAPRRRR